MTGIDSRADQNSERALDLRDLEAALRAAQTQSAEHREMVRARILGDALMVHGRVDATSAFDAEASSAHA